MSNANGGYIASSSTVGSSIGTDFEKNMFLHDFNGDGRYDLVYIKDGVVNVYYSDGEEIDINKKRTYSLSGTGLDNNGNFFITNFKNSNHNQTIGYVYRDKIATLALQKNETRNSFLSSISTYGTGTSIDYSRIDQNSRLPNGLSVYEKDEHYTAAFPYQNYNNYHWVVSGMRRGTGLEESENLSYRYKNAVIHKQGLASFVFEEVTTFDNVRGRQAVTEYDTQKYGIPKKASSATEIIDNNFYTNVKSNKELTVRLTSQQKINLLTGDTVKTQYEYNLYGNPTKVTTKYGNDLTEEKQTTYQNSLSHTFNIVGLPLSITTTVTRGSQTHTQSVTNTYNNKFLPASTTEKIGNNITSVKNFTYDDFSNLTGDTIIPYNISSLSVSSTNVYSANGRNLMRSVNSLGQETTYSCEGYNRLSSTTDHKGRITRFEYDEAGRLIRTQYPDYTIETSSYSWDQYGRPEGRQRHIVLTKATGKPDIMTYYDVSGREIKKGEKRFDGSFLYVDKIYNERGLLQKESLPYKGSSPTLWNEYTYDNYDRVTAINYASGKRDTYSYSGKSVTSVIDGISTTKTHNAAGEVIRVTDPAGTITYNLRADGQPSSVVAPGNATTRFEYDTYGRQTKLIDPSAGTKTFAYDNASNTTTETDANGKWIKVYSDKYGRTIKKNKRRAYYYI